jgi:hypothetical protein
MISGVMPKAFVKSARTAYCAISSIEVGTSPLELEMPALLNKITSRSWANPSVNAGSPVIHGSGKVHEEEQRDVDLCAEATVGEATVREANAGSLNKLRRYGQSCGDAHGATFF